MSARTGARLLAGAALICAALLPAPAAGSATPPSISVVGGEENWRPERSFGLEWRDTAPAEGAPTAIRYVIRDPLGTAVVGPDRIAWPLERIWLTVPATPGAYTAEIQLERGGGALSGLATAKLRFDDRRPGPLTAPTLPPWIGRTAFPLTIRLAGPASPAPISGIRGFAVSIGPAPGAGPCAHGGRCEAAETILADQAGGGTLTVAALPAGTNHLSAVAVAGSGLASADPARTSFLVDLADPVTRLEGVPPGWSNRSLILTARAQDGGSGMAAGDGSRSFTAIQVDGGPPKVQAGDSVGVALIEEGVHTIAHYARDRAGNVNDGGQVNGVANRPPAVATARIDRTAPEAAFLPQDPRDPELIRVAIRDSLSGADPGLGWIGIRPAGSDGQFTPLAAEPPDAAELRARWDSDSHPAGAYEFRAVVHDRAGNRLATGRRASGGAMTLSSPLKLETRLAAGFGGRVLDWHRCGRGDNRRRCRRERIVSFDERPTARTVPYGRGVLFGGRLDSRPQTPLAGAPIRILERFAPGFEPATRTTVVRSGADGRFSLRLAPGPSREVSAEFAGDRGLARSAGRPVRLSVRAGIGLRASARRAVVGGAPLILRGRVAAPAGSIPASGKAVQLQFRLPGLAWSEFRTVQTDRAGRFRYAYRFSDDDSRGASFQFRAHAPAQDNWPYEPGSSRPVAVRGV